MREQEKRIVTRPLSEHPPLLSVDMSTRREMNALRRVNAEEIAANHACALGAGIRRALAMAAFVDLRSRNAAEIAFENHRRVTATFSEPGKLNDTTVVIRRFKVRIFLFFLIWVSTAPLREGGGPIP
jgi:hypothetical protein